MPFFLLSAFRVMRVAGLSVACSAAWLVLRLFGRRGEPQLLRWYFEACGAGFVKVGQLLAMRYDLLPERYCDELGKLLDSVPPGPVEGVIATIEADLGRRVEDCYETFDRTPLASASIAQVHRARLHDGRDVVVKVMRPGVELQFRTDLANIRRIGRVAVWLRVLPNIDVAGVIDVLIRLTEEELDFRREARNTEILHRLMREDEVDHYAPAIHAEYCGRRVITMEMLTGVWLTEMIAAVRQDDRERLAAWAERGITPQRTSLLILRSMLEQFFHHGFFHADPHAANLVVLDGGTLGYVDFGMVGWIDERTQREQLRLRQCIAAGQLHAAYAALLDSLEPLPVRDLSRFELEFKELVHDWLLSIRSPTATLMEKSTGGFLLNIFAAVRHAGLAFPLTVVRLQRAFIIADISMLVIAPEVDWVPELERFLRAESRRRAVESLKAEVSIDAVMSGVATAASAYGLLQDFVYWARERLPDSARRRAQEPSAAEKTLQIAVRFARFVAVIVVLMVGGGAIIAPRFFSDTTWNQTVDLLRPWHWWITVGALFTALTLTRILRQFDRTMR